MNKSDIIDSVASATGLTTTKAKEAVNATFAAINTGLSKGAEVQVAGFGSFSVAARAARTGRNPRTGEATQIPASNGVKFKAGKSLKDSVQ